MTKEEALAMDLALEALESCETGHITDGGKQWHDEKLVDNAITAIKQALAAPVQEPVFKPCSCRWKGDKQVQQCTLHTAHIEAIHEWAERAKAAEAKLKEKTNDQ
jgi:hypothetical protein